MADLQAALSQLGMALLDFAMVILAVAPWSLPGELLEDLAAVVATLRRGGR